MGLFLFLHIKTNPSPCASHSALPKRDRKPLSSSIDLFVIPKKRQQRKAAVVEPSMTQNHQSAQETPVTQGTRRRRSLSTPLTGFFLIVLLSLGCLEPTDAQEQSSSDGVQEAVVNVQDEVLHSLEQEGPDASSPRPRTPIYGNLTSALYRFDARLLGHEYMQAVKRFEEYIGSNVDPMGARFAAQRTRSSGTRDVHTQCFAPPDEERDYELEKRKKFHDPKGRETYEYLREEMDFFYGPGENDTYVTPDHKWAWRAAAVYSAQHAGRQREFRNTVQAELDARPEGYFGGTVSGTFWYPPNAVREWHTNVWDMFRHPQTDELKPWRMYYVRLKAATPEGGLDTDKSPQTHPDYFVDKSAMHLVEGQNIPPERFRELGAYPLRREQHTPGGPLNVWRIPDQDGYLSLFRLQFEPPYRWHCIVADGSVHRYSMGMSLDDAGVEAMLRHAGVEL